MPEWLQPVATFVGALIVGGAGLYLAGSQRSKNRADAAGTLTGKALEMVESQEKRVLKLERRVEELEERVDVLEEENECLREVAGALEGQVESLGQEPVRSLRELAELAA